MIATKSPAVRGRARLVLAAMAALVSGALPGTGAEPGPSRPRVIRRIEQPGLAFGNPRGLAYSPRTHTFLVSPAEGPSRVQVVTHMGESAGFEALDVVGGDALNMAFDNRQGRLLTLSGRQLIAVSCGGNGRRGRATQAGVDPTTVSGVRAASRLREETDDGKDRQTQHPGHLGR